MSCLRNRLGFDMISSVERAVIWKLYIAPPDPEIAALEIAENLLVNPNKDSYQILSIAEGS
jgi:phosphoribosylformylglycinamidine (FGAM) synthase PurS component